jgi:hydroxymethylbilane synthase
VLAGCGLDRLGLSHEVGHRFDPDELLPEAGQGALALQVRSGEEELGADADDAETRRRVEAERGCVAAIGAGCLAPVAAHHDGTELRALIADEDGLWVERRTGTDPSELAAALLAAAAEHAAAGSS